ncbi:MAG: hypothetical protein Q8N42_00935 [bacterium]|nr:hypothetical protein [bacterium]
MLVGILFYAGLIMVIVTGISSWYTKGENKRGIVAFPFGLLLAAIVAKYLGL